MSMYACTVYFCWHKLDYIWKYLFGDSKISNFWTFTVPYYSYKSSGSINLGIMTLGDTSTRTTHFFGEKFVTASWNMINRLHGERKCALLNHFLVQELTTANNPISRQFWWMWNLTFWLRVEEIIDNLTKYKNKLPKTRGSKIPFISRS